MIAFYSPDAFRAGLNGKRFLNALGRPDSDDLLKSRDASCIDGRGTIAKISIIV
jgi:hypothetical protein